MSNQSIPEKFSLPKRFEKIAPNVWSEFTALDKKYNPVNLGQGFSDAPPPPFVRDALLATINNPDYSTLNQYARAAGHLRLVEALSALYSKLISRKIDPLTEILATCGAYEALFASVIGHVDNGDEVIIIEPFFDCYEPLVFIAGGIPRYVPLRLSTKSDNITAADYCLDDVELANAFNGKSKMIIINTPHNPTGKIFNREELTKIANLCEKYNVICVSDEVYEWLVYDGNEHIRMCTLPGMWERTITIGSAGKTFSLTGWKTGWAYGPANLLANLEIVHQYCVDTIPTLIQEALAIMFENQLKCFDTPECYFKSLPLELRAKRDFMMKCLESVGMKPILPQGGFFMLTDWTKIESSIDMSGETDRFKDYRFAKWITKNVGVHGIPPSAFVSNGNKAIMENFIRFCFFKKPEKLQQCAEALEKWAKTRV